MKKIHFIIAAVMMAVCLFILSGCSGSGESAKLTVLMYHHFEENVDNFITVSDVRFREQLTALKNDGYETVTLSQLIAYAEGEEGAELPEKPLLITMDDGYTSNLTIAAPILEELAMNAVVFVIGINEGETFYAHSGEVLSPERFAYEDAMEWIEKGVIDVQSHTYDLHQRESYGYSGREGVLQLEGESRDEYEAVVLEDCRQFREARADVPTELTALAYPFGFCTEEIDKVLESEFKVTFTTQEHINKVVPGDVSSVRMLGRFNVSGESTGDMLVEKLRSVR